MKTRIIKRVNKDFDREVTSYLPQYKKFLIWRYFDERYFYHYETSTHENTIIVQFDSLIKCNKFINEELWKPIIYKGFPIYRGNYDSENYTFYCDCFRTGILYGYSHAFYFFNIEDMKEFIDKRTACKVIKTIIKK